jgi:hypothetical protein
VEPSAQDGHSLTARATESQVCSSPGRTSSASYVTRTAPAYCVVCIDGRQRIRRQNARHLPYTSWAVAVFSEDDCEPLRVNGRLSLIGISRLTRADSIYTR